VASELVPDLLNSLVAAGTLALAGGTVYTARVAVRAGLDASAPQVVVDWLTVPDNPVSRTDPMPSNPPAIQPGTAWVMATHGGLPIGMTAQGQVRNEGETTALLKFEHETDVQVLGVMGLGGQLPGGLSRQEVWYVLNPGSAASFRLVWWRIASDWAKSSEHSSTTVSKVRLT